MYGHKNKYLHDNYYILDEDIVTLDIPEKSKSTYPDYFHAHMKQDVTPEISARDNVISFHEGKKLSKLMKWYSL